MSPEFLKLLRMAVAQCRTQQACADALGIALQRLNGVLNNKTKYSFNIVNCLHLAQLLNVAPSRVLRAAGKAPIADLLEALYGRSTLTPTEARLLTAIEALPAHRRRALIAFVQAWSEEVTPGVASHKTLTRPRRRPQ